MSEMLAMAVLNVEPSVEVLWFGVRRLSTNSTSGATLTWVSATGHSSFGWGLFRASRWRRTAHFGTAHTRHHRRGGRGRARIERGRVSGVRRQAGLDLTHLEPVLRLLVEHDVGRELLLDHRAQHLELLRLAVVVVRGDVHRMVVVIVHRDDR